MSRKLSHSNKFAQVVLVVILMTMLTLMVSVVAAQTELPDVPTAVQTQEAPVEVIPATNEAGGDDAGDDGSEGAQEDDGDTGDELRDTIRELIIAGLLVVGVVVLLAVGGLMLTAMRLLAKSVPVELMPLVYSVVNMGFQGRQAALDVLKKMAHANNVDWDDSVIDLVTTLSKQEWQVLIDEARAKGHNLPDIPGFTPASTSSQAARRGTDSSVPPTFG